MAQDDTSATVNNGDATEGDSVLPNSNKAHHRTKEDYEAEGDKEQPEEDSEEDGEENGEKDDEEDGEENSEDNDDKVEMDKDDDKDDGEDEDDEEEDVGFIICTHFLSFLFIFSPGFKR